MPVSNDEAWGRFCDCLGSNIVVQYSVGPIIFYGRITAREYVDRLGNQVHPMTQTFPMKVSKTTVPPFTQLELLSHGPKNMKVNFSIFPGQHNYQI
jgi:hypothetical protein